MTPCLKVNGIKNIPIAPKVRVIVKIGPRDLSLFGKLQIFVRCNCTDYIHVQNIKQLTANVCCSHIKKSRVCAWHEDISEYNIASTYNKWCSCKGKCLYDMKSPGSTMYQGSLSTMTANFKIQVTVVCYSDLICAKLLYGAWVHGCEVGRGNGIAFWTSKHIFTNYFTLL